MSRSKLVISGHFDKRQQSAVTERVKNLAFLFSETFDVVEIEGHRGSLSSRLKVFMRLYERALFGGKRGERLLVYGWPLPAITFLPLTVLNLIFDRKIIVDIVDWFDAKSNSRIYNLLKNIDTYLLKRISYGLISHRVLISSKLAVEYPRGKNFIFPQIIRNFTPRTPIATDQPLSFVYAGFPFPRIEKDVPVINYKDRIDLIIAGLNKAAGKTRRPCVLHLAGLTREQLELAVPSLNNISGAAELEIQFHGKLNHAALMAVIAKCHYFLLLREKKKSSDYGFPTKVTDALQIGVPVIYNDTSDLKVYLDGTECRDCTLEGYPSLVEDLLMSYEFSSDLGTADLKSNPLPIEMFRTPKLEEFLR